MRDKERLERLIDGRPTLSMTQAAQILSRFTGRNVDVQMMLQYRHYKRFPTTLEGRVTKEAFTTWVLLRYGETATGTTPCWR